MSLWISTSFWIEVDIILKNRVLYPRQWVILVSLRFCVRISQAHYGAHQRENTIFTLRVILTGHNHCSRSLYFVLALLEVPRQWKVITEHIYNCTTSLLRIQLFLRNNSFVDWRTTPFKLCHGLTFFFIVFHDDIVFDPCLEGDGSSAFSWPVILPVIDDELAVYP